MSNPPAWIPSPDYDRVIIACTARAHGPGIRRLPDRIDRDGRVGAVQVETAQDATVVFAALDAPGRTLFVDVERKQPVDLMAIARQTVSLAQIAAIKPNDVTVSAFDILISNVIGPDISGLRVGIIGAGNLAMKFILLLLERGATVFVHDRKPQKAELVAAAATAVRPRYSTVSAQTLTNEADLDLFVTAISATAAIDATWVNRLAPQAIVIDAGIGNLAPEFIEQAIATGHQVLRLDTRATAYQTPQAAKSFFEEVFGTGTIGTHQVASGGVVGRRGTVIVDSIYQPRRIFGIASGTGALVPESDQTPEERKAVADVIAQLSL